MKKNNEMGRAFRMHGNWKIQAELLKRDFPILSSSDLTYEKGKEKELLRRIERKLNKKRDEIIEMIKKVQPIKTKAQLNEWVRLEFLHESNTNNDRPSEKE